MTSAGKSAQAQSRFGGRVRPPPDLSGPKPATIRAYSEFVAMREAGIARTSVDKRFSDDDKLLGSLGFLCGIQPSALDRGAAAAHGVDPQGRFIGGKLKLYNS